MEYEEEEILEKTKKYIFPGLIIALGLAGYFQSFQLFDFAKYLLIGFLAFGIRETGQRILALYMDASVETNFSMEGTSLALMTTVFAILSSTSFAILIPSTNSFSQKRYDHWGKSVDAMWSKRQFWVATAGTTALTITTGFLHYMNYDLFVQGFALFTLTNMIPLRDLLIEGSTDGTYILFHSGFIYLLLAGVNMILFGYAAF